MDVKGPSIPGVLYYLAGATRPQVGPGQRLAGGPGGGVPRKILHFSTF